MPDLSRYATFLHYGRFSSRRQRRGHSEERQGDAAAAWAAANGITFSPLSATDRGLSAFHGRHRDKGALGILLAALEASQVPTPSLLVVEAVDRLSRLPSVEGLDLVFRGLIGRGCDLLILERQQLFDRETLDDNLGALVQLVIDIAGAHAFSRRLSRRMKAAHQKGRERIAAGEVVRKGWAPSWIDATGDGWQLNDYAAVIRRLLELSQTLGANATAKRLNAEGHRSPRGRNWTQGGVNSVLSSPALAGGRPTRRRDADGVVWGYWPALIERGEWEALRRRISARDGSPSHGGNQQAIWFIGQGVTVCSSCGRPVGNRVASYVNAAGEKYRVRYARCRGRTDGTCTQPAIQLSTLTAAILTRLAAGDLARLFPQQEDSRLSMLQAREGVLRGEIEQQQAAAANGRESIARLLQHAPAAVDAVAQAVAAAEAEEERLSGELRAVRVEIEQLNSRGQEALAAGLQGQVRDLLQTFARGEDTAEQRRAANTLLRRLDVRIALDAAGQRFGLAVGDAAPRWQTINAALAGQALEKGRPGGSYLRLRIPAEALQQAIARHGPGDTVTIPFATDDAPDFEL